MQDITDKITVDPAITSVNYYQLTAPIFSGRRIGSVIGIWESDSIDGTSDLLSWKEIVLSCTKPTGSDVYVFVSNQATTTEDPVWRGPYRNDTTEILSFSEQYMKIRAVLIQTGEVPYVYGYQPNLGPTIESITLKGISSGSASKFFTQAFNIGFNPQHILMTAETDIPSGSIVRFGVTNLDTINLEKYQFFDLHEITKLNRLPVTGEKIKIYIEMSGNSGDSIVIDEFAVMFSGEGQVEVNRL